MELMKTCKHCERVLTLENYRRILNRDRDKYYLNSYCNDCEKERNLKYIKEHPEWSRKNNQLGHFKWKMKMTGGKCQICGEDRTLDVAHIIPRNGKDRRRLEPRDNLLGLCPTHHRLFDEDKLNKEEYAKIQERVELARKKYAKV